MAGPTTAMWHYRWHQVVVSGEPNILAYQELLYDQRSARHKVQCSLAALLSDDTKRCGVRMCSVSPDTLCDFCLAFGDMTNYSMIDG